MDELKRTPLWDLHREAGGRMVPFAGWEMPVQFPAGVIAEHQHTRSAASLFDVGHMCQISLAGPGAAEALEALTPAALVGLAAGRQRYALLTNDDGGILDDVMVANRGDHLLLVANAANAEAVLAHLAASLSGVEVTPLPDRALIALQGPLSQAALARLAPDAAGMRFMDAATLPVPGGEIWVSRSGYTGEDGFEISLPAEEALGLAEALLAMEEVAPAGLGARDTLRLEAGLPLHGADLDATTTPVEAGLAWSIGKARRPGGARPGGFPGAETILDQLQDGPGRQRVGILPDGRAPMRPGTRLFDGDADAGTVTSGAYGPSLGRPISMAYLRREHAAPGKALTGEVRGRMLPATVVELPFRPATYKR